METQKVSPNERKVGGKTINFEKDSLQYNAQDMDQQQQVDVNPSQLNTQNLNIYIKNSISDLSGKITGAACIEGSMEPVANAEILLYFGIECKNPIYKTSSDSNGNFSIEELPPGYYTISAKAWGNYWYRSCHIKVLPGHKVVESILLKKAD